MRSNWRKQMMISALALTLSATNVAPVFASAAPDGKTNAADIAQTMGTTAQWNRWEKEWETLKNDWTQISLSPGSNATELNFAWYTPKQTNDDHSNANVPKLIIGEGHNMKNAKVYEAEQTAVKDEQDNNGETYNSNKVTATGLKENKTYYYSYDNGNGYTKPAKYTTKSTNNFSFAFVGDPQIGSSNELKGKDTKEFYDAQSNAVKSDAFNWSSTLNAALEKTDDQLSFVVSAGDQIQTTKKKSPNKDASKSEIEYTGYLSPEALKSLPVAPGNIKNDSTDEKDQKYLTYLKSIMDEKAIETVKKQGSSVINPEGVLYMTAGSSSGSKYYDLVPRQQTYIAHRWQEDVPTYSVVDVTENSLTINTYRTDNDEKIDETFSITKSKGDTTSLNAEIKASESIVKQKDAYTTESYRVFEQALTGAKEVAADKKATKDEVENALKVLTNAKAGLEKKATTKPATVKKPTAEKKVVVAKASAKLKDGKKKVTIKIKKASVSGYQIKYASNKNFKKAKTRNTRKTIYTIKSLRSKKKCYVKVRAYKVVKGKKIYGSYSKVLKVTVK